jgi:ABC-type multidrug transport system fused ATPase/permease subunit
MFNRMRTTIANITPYVFTKANASRLSAAFTATIVGLGLDVLVPYLYGETFSVFLQGAAGTATLPLIGVELGPYAMVGVSMAAYKLRGLVINFRGDIQTPIAPKAASELFNQYAAHAADTSLEAQREANEGDDLLRIQKGFGAMYSITNQLFTTVVPVVLGTAFTSSVIAWNYGGEVGAGIGGIVAVCTAYSVSNTKKNVELRNKSLETGNESFNDLMRGSQHARTIQSNNNQKYEKERLQKSHEKWAAAEAESNSFQYYVGRRHDTILDLGFTGLCFLTAHGILEGKLPPEAYGTLFTLFLQFFGPVAAFGAATSQIISGLADLEAVFDHLKIPSKIKDLHPEKELKLQGNNATVEFKNVVLTFDDGTKILDGVSFKAPAGKKTVIVGGSGAGKSTVANLIDRSYDPDSGEVLIDGQNIKEFSLQNVRSIISTVQQKPDLFHESIYKNIAYGALSFPGGVKKEDVIQAAFKACLTEFIESQADKYETDVGKDGARLSGGQAQRVAIARALVRKPKVLICDEATSALDSATAASIQQEIDKIPDVTKIVVTHHLDEAVNADLIIVLKKGKVAEQGTHEELLAKNGEYTRLWLIQHPIKEVYSSSDEKHAVGTAAPKAAQSFPASTHYNPTMFGINKTSTLPVAMQPASTSSSNKPQVVIHFMRDDKDVLKKTAPKAGY